ncbi:MAG: hypothetical protein U5J83_09170 [Bryobacterales bacterium]|nr:hypothetical protein [Bryobacterales bacterium]
MDEVSRALGAKHARGAGRPRGIEAHHNDVVVRHPDLPDGQFQPIGDLLQADLRPFLGAGGMFEERFDEKLLFATQQGVIDGGATEIHSGHDTHRVTSNSNEINANLSDYQDSSGPDVAFEVF